MATWIMASETSMRCHYRAPAGAVGSSSRRFARHAVITPQLWHARLGCGGPSDPSHESLERIMSQYVALDVSNDETASRHRLARQACATATRHGGRGMVATLSPCSTTWARGISRPRCGTPTWSPRVQCPTTQGRAGANGRLAVVSRNRRPPTSKRKPRRDRL
jgi:hypothetical protein